MAQLLAHTPSLSMSCQCKPSSDAFVRASPALRQCKDRLRLRHCAARDVKCFDSTARFFVGGNWKANGSPQSVSQLITDLNAGSVPDNVDVVCAPPFLYLDQLKKQLDSRKYGISAQNCWLKGTGAYTGEVPAEMLKDFGVQWTILGHSERRALCGESNDIVGQKVNYALDKGLSVMACIGETLQQRKDGSLFDVLDAQMQAIADNVSDWSRVVIAYEPVWAIGTGEVASPEQAQEVHSYLRKWLADKVSPATSAETRIIYGGSVNDANCFELAEKPDIDGFLVGGASLKGASFLKIVSAGANAK